MSLNPKSVSTLASTLTTMLSLVSIDKQLGGKFDISLPGINIQNIATLEQRQSFISTCLTSDPILIEQYSDGPVFSGLLENLLIPFEKDYFPFSLTQIPKLDDENREKVGGALPSSPHERFQKAFVKRICVHLGLEKLFYIVSVAFQLSSYFNFNPEDSDFDSRLSQYLGRSCRWSNFGHLEVLGLVGVDGLGPAPNPYSFFTMFYHSEPYQFFVGLAAAIRGDNRKLVRDLLNDLKIPNVWRYVTSAISVHEQNDGKILIQESYNRRSAGKFDSHLLNETNIIRWALLFKCEYDYAALSSPRYVQSKEMSDFLLNISYGK